MFKILELAKCLECIQLRNLKFSYNVSSANSLQIQCKLQL